MKQTRTYPAEYKAEAVKLARETSVKTASDELGVPYGTLNGWVIAAKNGKIDTGQGSQTPETAMTQAARIQQLEAEIKLIKKENSRLNELNEFLEEAASFFAASRQKSTKKNGLNS